MLTGLAPSLAEFGQSEYGEVFTRRWVVETILDLVGYTADRDLAGLVLLEPSAGSGAFLFPAVERLVASAQQHGRAWSDLTGCIQAWELQADHAVTVKAGLLTLLDGAGVPVAVTEQLVSEWVRIGDFLLADDVAEADVVVGNPPYIRLEDLPRELSALYRRTWSTMGGRADVYVGFIERGLAQLRPGGILGFICADRWMRNQYGAGLRSLVGERYAVEHVWVMHDVDAFEAQVSAYPAITVLRAGKQGPVVAAETTEVFGPQSASELVVWSSGDTQTLVAPGVVADRLPHWFPGGDLWPAGSPARLRLIEYLNDGFAPLHDPAIGTVVSIGVATGADKVFVTTDAGLVESDRLLPLSMPKDLTSGEYRWSGNYLVNPWTTAGDLVELASYPRLASYLRDHAELRDRFVARKNPAVWYRTIDKVNAARTARPKLLLQDMQARIWPVLEPGGHYPHHNLYYIVSDTWDMEVLGGLLLSRIAQAFIEAYCVKMRGGTLRFQAQYLKRLRVPAPGGIDAALAGRLRTAFRTRDVQAATRAAAEAYRIDDLEDYDLAD